MESAEARLYPGRAEIDRAARADCNGDEVSLIWVTRIAPAGGEEERVSRGVLQRVLKAVLADLHEPHHRKHGEPDRGPVGDEREGRHDEQRAPDSDEREDARDREQLEHHADRVVPGEVIRLEGPDELLRVRRARAGLARRDEQRPVEQVLTRAVDPVQQHDEAGDQEQILVVRQEVEGTFFRERLSSP